MIPYKQLSLADIFEDCQNKFENDKPAFLSLKPKIAAAMSSLLHSLMLSRNTADRFGTTVSKIVEHGSYAKSYCLEANAEKGTTALAWFSARTACEKEFIIAELIKKYTLESDYSLFLCGPQAMYEFVDKEIATLGLRRKFVRHELFGEYFNPSREADYPANVAPEFKVTVCIAGNETTIIPIKRCNP